MGKIKDACCARNHGVLLKVPQIIRDATLETVMTDPGLEAVIANTDPADYLEQILILCYHRGCIISRIEDDIKLQ